MPGVVVYRFDAPLFHSNSQAFFDEAMALVDAADPTPHTLVIDGEVIGDIDSTGIERIADLRSRLVDQGIDVRLARFHADVLEQMMRSKDLSGLDPERIAIHPGEAVTDATERRSRS